MEIRFIKTLIGDGFAYREGDVQDLPAEAAMEYVGAGLAEIVAKPAAERAERAVPKAKAQKR
jgi:hypothetical protein